MKPYYIFASIFLLIFWQKNILFSYYYVFSSNDVLVYDNFNCQLPLNYFYMKDRNPEFIDVGLIKFDKLLPYIEQFSLSYSIDYNNSLTLNGKSYPLLESKIKESVAYYKFAIDSGYYSVWQGNGVEIINIDDDGVILPKLLETCLMESW